MSVISITDLYEKTAADGFVSQPYRFWTATTFCLVFFGTECGQYPFVTLIQKSYLLTSSSVRSASAPVPAIRQLTSDNRLDSKRTIASFYLYLRVNAQVTKVVNCLPIGGQRSEDLMSLVELDRIIWPFTAP